MNDSRIALFLMLGQSASRLARTLPEVASPHSINLAPNFDLAAHLPEVAKDAFSASEGYRLFFVFESYLRDLVLEVLSKDDPANWWEKVPEDVRIEVAKLEDTEEAKRWMALGSRDKAALMTYPQLLRVIETCWKMGFDDLLRDRGLLQEARLISHLRNTLCHMATISDEEMERIRQVMRDWFRMVAP